MLYRIDLCISGEIHRFYRHSVSPDLALYCACLALGKALGYCTAWVRQQLTDYEITEVKK
jgi:hypothetical protein